MKHLIKNPRDFWAGVMFLVLGGMFAGVALSYKIGTAARMGPGFFPVVLGAILMILGIAIAVGAMKGREGPAVDRYHWKPILWVLGSIVVFGLLLKVLGMLVAGVLLVIGASLGSEEFKLRDVLLLAVGLVIFCALVFVGGLKLPIPMCPGLEVFESLRMCRV